MKKILIISDYGQTVGAGHYTRCNTLAKMLSLTCKINFISSNKIPDKKNKKRIKYFYVKNIVNYKIINKFISKDKYSSIIVDTYKDISKLIKNINIPRKNIFCFDDFCTKKIKTNLINHNPFFRKTDYIKNKHKIFAGEKYTLIDKNQRKGNISFNKLNFLISCGLYDQNNNLIKIINFLKKLNKNLDLKVYVALDKKSKHFSSVKNNIQKLINFNLIFSKKKYLQALNQCNISITPLGVSVWERFYVGIPCMIFVKEKKENIILKKLEKNNAVLKYYINNDSKNFNYFKDINELKKNLKKISYKNKKLFSKNIEKNYKKILLN